MLKISDFKNQMDLKGKSNLINVATNQLFAALKTIFVYYYSIYTFTASKKVNLI